MNNLKRNQSITKFYNFGAYGVSLLEQRLMNN